MKKQLANIITISRIFESICLIFFPAFSFGFYAVYLFCGLTDMIDGTIARKTKTVSAFGARLDTAADIIFVLICSVKMLPLICLPVLLWIWIAVIASVKTGTILYGLIRSKKLISIHSVLNKATGFLLFIFPFTLGIIEPEYSSAMVCFLATVSAIYEVYYIKTEGANNEIIN